MANSPRTLAEVLRDHAEWMASAIFCGSPQFPHVFVEFMPGLFQCERCGKVSSPDIPPGAP